MDDARPTPTTTEEHGQAKKADEVVMGVKAVNDEGEDGSGASIRSGRSEGGRSTTVPLRMKIVSILLVTAIGFGSHWSSGVTGAMKSTLKKVSAC